MRNHFEAKFILGALLASLSAAPAVLAQSQSQTSAQDSSQAAASAKTQGHSDASASSSTSTQPKTQNASGNEPQMESQEAPRRNRSVKQREERERRSPRLRLPRFIPRIRSQASQATVCQWSAMEINLAIHPTRRTRKIPSVSPTGLVLQRQTRHPETRTKRCGAKRREQFTIRWRKSTSESVRFRTRFRNMEPSASTLRPACDKM